MDLGNDAPQPGHWLSRLRRGAEVAPAAAGDDTTTESEAAVPGSGNQAGRRGFVTSLIGAVTGGMFINMLWSKPAAANLPVFDAANVVQTSQSALSLGTIVQTGKDALTTAKSALDTANTANQLVGLGQRIASMKSPGQIFSIVAQGASLLGSSKLGIADNEMRGTLNMIGSTSTQTGSLVSGGTSLANSIGGSGSTSMDFSTASQGINFAQRSLTYLGAADGPTVATNRTAVKENTHMTAVGLSLYHQQAVSTSNPKMQSWTDQITDAGGPGGDQRTQLAVMSGLLLAILEELQQHRYLACQELLVHATAGLTSTNSFVLPNAPKLGTPTGTVQQNGSIFQ